MSARPGTGSLSIQAVGPGAGRTTLDELLALARRPAWQADALCHEYPEVNFFPERGESAAPAQAVCGRCAVRAESLTWALEHGQGPGLSGGHGVWGGTSARQRRQLRPGHEEGVRARAEAQEARRRRLDEQAEARAEAREAQRWLWAEERRSAIAAAWLEDPRRSASSVVRALGIAVTGSAVTAAVTVRRELEAAGELERASPAA